MDVHALLHIQRRVLDCAGLLAEQVNAEVPLVLDFGLNIAPSGLALSLLSELCGKSLDA
jgi:hypothetical protein